MQMGGNYAKIWRKEGETLGYLFLVLALLAGVTKGYCGKKTGNLTADIKDAMTVNVVRMVFCIFIGLILILASGQRGKLLPDWRSLGIMALSGLFTSAFVVTWLLAVKRSAYLMVEVFLMLGVLVPIGASALFFGETVEAKEWIGIALLVVATLIMCFYNNTQKQKLTFGALVLLILCGFSNGMTDLSQKLFAKTATDIPASVFNFYTYIFSAVILLPVLLATEKGSVTHAYQNAKKILSKAAVFVAVMAVCLFANSFFKTLAAGYLPAAQLYPLNQGGSLILSSVMAAVFFKEKLTLPCILGILTAFAGLLFINVL